MFLDEMTPDGQLLPSGTTDRKEVALFCVTRKPAPYCWEWGWPAVLFLEALSLRHSSALWLLLQSSQDEPQYSELYFSYQTSAMQFLQIQGLCFRAYGTLSLFPLPPSLPLFHLPLVSPFHPCPLSHLPLVPLFLPLPILSPLPFSFSFLWIAAWISEFCRLTFRFLKL